MRNHHSQDADLQEICKFCYAVYDMPPVLTAGYEAVCPNCGGNEDFADGYLRCWFNNFAEHAEVVKKDSRRLKAELVRVQDPPPVAQPVDQKPQIVINNSKVILTCS